MQKALQVQFRGMEQSDAIIESIEQKAKKMERLNKRITSCKVVVSSPHNHHNKGKLYEVNIDVGVPSNNVVVHQSGEDAYVAVRDAFAAVERQLKTMAEKTKGKAKVKQMPIEEEVSGIEDDFDDMYDEDTGQAAA